MTGNVSFLYFIMTFDIIVYTLQQNNKKLNRRKTKRTSPLKQRDLDDIFIKELCYVGMEVQIKEHLVKKEENKRRAFLWVSIV